MKCSQYLPRLKRCCRHDVPHGYRKCYQHRSHRFPKPEDCPVCISKLTGWAVPLNPCQHWICWDCVIHSGKKTCPICRSNIKIPTRHLFMLHFYEKQVRNNVEDINFELIFGETIRTISNDNNDNFTSSEIDDSENPVEND